jgi:transposase InsO family protein
VTQAVLRRLLEPGQYTSVEFANRLADWGIAASHGSVGDAYDNAAMEAFWATLKKEVAVPRGVVGNRGVIPGVGQSPGSSSAVTSGSLSRSG